MRRTKHVPELGLRGRPVRPDVQREPELEQLFAFLPVHRRGNRQGAGACRQRYPLGNRRGARQPLHHNDGVGNDGRPVSPEDYYAGLNDAEAAIAAVTCAPVGADLLTAVLRGLNTIDGAQPIPVRDVEI